MTEYERRQQELDEQFTRELEQLSADSAVIEEQIKAAKKDIKNAIFDKFCVFYIVYSFYNINKRRNFLNVILMSFKNKRNQFIKNGGFGQL